MKLSSAFIAFVAVLGLCGAQASHADPLATRTFRLYTAPLGPSIEGTVNQLKPLLQLADRNITQVKEIQRIGFGKLTGIEMTHVSNHPEVLAKWHSQDVYVAPLFGNAFNQAMEVIRFQQMANKPLVDVEIIQTINIGKVTGLRLYFGDK